MAHPQTDDRMVWDAAFDGLFTVEYPRVVSVLRVAVGDAALAEQLTQDAFADLLRQWPAISAAESPDVWVRSHALQRAVHRDRADRVQRLLRFRSARSAASTSGVVEDPVRIALASLSVRQRAVIALRVLDGRSPADVAHLLDCRPASAEADEAGARYVLAGALRRGPNDPGLDDALRAALRAQLQDTGVDAEDARATISVLDERHDSRRRFRLALVGAGLVAAALIAAAITQPWTDRSHPVEPHPRLVPVSGLYGLWRAELADAARTQLLTLTPSSGGGGFTVYPPCGEIDGVLAVTSLGAFAAAVDGASGRCSVTQGTPASVRWLEQVALASPVDGGWLLVDRNGHRVATLRPARIGAFPKTINLEPIRLLGHVPPLPADDRASLDRLITVPGDATSANAANLVGTWHPPVPSQAFVTFAEDGSYTASDGWHCSAGRWAVDPLGQLAFAPGLPGNVDCPRPQEALTNVPQWFADADVVGVTPGELQLFDDTGRLLRTVQSAPVATASSSP